MEKEAKEEKNNIEPKTVEKIAFSFSHIQDILFLFSFLIVLIVFKFSFSITNVQRLKT